MEDTLDQSHRIKHVQIDPTAAVERDHRKRSRNVYEVSLFFLNKKMFLLLADPDTPFECIKRRMTRPHIDASKNKYTNRRQHVAHDCSYALFTCAYDYYYYFYYHQRRRGRRDERLHIWKNKQETLLRYHRRTCSWDTNEWNVCKRQKQYFHINGKWCSRFSDSVQKFKW